MVVVMAMRACAPGRRGQDSHRLVEEEEREEACEDGGLYIITVFRSVSTRV